MNIDIFSVRTNVLQNTLNMGVSGELSKKNLSIGNFLDNTTVYIGKYIGSALYVDAMLNMSASDNPDVEYYSTDSILFQPEFGLELEFPIINILVIIETNLTINCNNTLFDSSFNCVFKVTIQSVDKSFTNSLIMVI